MLFPCLCHQSPIIAGHPNLQVGVELANGMRIVSTYINRDNFHLMN